MNIEELKENAVINFDPNMTLCGRVVKQTIRLTFAQWEHRGVFDVTVRGNITGLDAIKSALGNLYESLPYTELPFDDGGYATIHLGDLQCDDEDGGQEEWLGNMLISSEIISIEPDGKF